MVATGWILYQHYTSHTPTPLEYKWALGPEECPGMASPEDIDLIHLILYAACNCSDSQLSDSEIHPSTVSEEIHLRILVEISGQNFNISPCRADKLRKRERIKLVQVIIDP